jgi:hypothetical protein
VEAEQLVANDAVSGVRPGHGPSAGWGIGPIRLQIQTTTPSPSSAPSGGSHGRRWVTSRQPVASRAINTPTLHQIDDCHAFAVLV